MSALSAAGAVDQRVGAQQSDGRLVPRWAECGAVAAYVVLAFWVTSGLWRHIGALSMVNNLSDVPFFEWDLVRATRIFTHPENPFFSPQ